LSSSNLVRLAYKKEAVYGVKHDAVKASKVIQDLTYTALKGGAGGNAISIQYVNTGTAGAEAVTVSGNAIVVAIQSGTSTATQVRAAVIASGAAMALLASVVVTGTGGTAQTTVAATALTGGLYDWNTARFVSEKYSGTPDTTESAQIRTDRMSSGQVVTGLKVDGGHNFELAKEEALEDFLESAMFNAWDTTSITGTMSLTVDATAHTLTRGSGDFAADGLKVGDIVTLSGFTNAGNNVPVQVMVVTALVVTFAGPSGMVTETHSATFTRGDKLSIGITQKSLSIEKSFLDLTTKAILYKGAIVSQMELDIAYGQLITGNFGTSANGYSTADAANEFMTYQEYIDAAATTNSMNGSVDMPFTMTDISGSFAQDGFCIQSLKIQLNNNLQPQTCIGNAAPEAYSAGTAAIKIDMSSYLKDSNWDLLARKLSQQSFSLGFLVKNTDGWYGFFFPAIQVSFDDPSSGGANQQISMSMSGTAKVGSNGESAMSIYRIPG
jgi:hypothetical protein